MKTKIKGHSELVRDNNSSAVINNSRTALQRAKAKKQGKIDVAKRLNNLEDNVSQILAILKQNQESNK